MLSRAQGAQRNCGGVEVSGVEVSGGVPVLSFESSSLPLPQPASTHVNPTMASNTRAWRTYLAHAHSVDSGFIKNGKLERMIGNTVDTPNLGGCTLQHHGVALARTAQREPSSRSDDYVSPLAGQETEKF